MATCHARCVTDYSLGDVARILKVSPRRLRYWRKTQLVGASAARNGVEGGAESGAEIGPDREDGGYGFRDLVVLRTIVSMIDRGVSIQRIRRQLEILRGRLPELPEPAGALRLASEDSDHIVLRRDGRWEEVGGQLLLEFAGALGGEATPVTPLAASGPAPRRGLRVEPDDALGWFEKGCELDVDAHTWTAAAAAYEKALELDPEYADAYCNLGAVRYNQGQRVAARRAFEACLVRSPDHVEANFNLANVLEEAGEDEKALVLYRRALAVDPIYPDLHINLALLYEKLGRMRPACRHWRRYLQIDPQGSWAAVARQRLERESEQA
jgi:tetratricopeptide (TPR) repeat protein